GGDLERVVAEQAERGDITGRGQRLGHVVRAANDAGPGQGVHVWLVGGLEGGPPAQRLLRFIGTAVGDDNRVLHASLDIGAKDRDEVAVIFSICSRSGNRTATPQRRVACFGGLLWQGRCPRQRRPPKHGTFRITFPASGSYPAQAASRGGFSPRRLNRSRTGSI